MSLENILEKYFTEEEAGKIAAAINTGLPVIINGIQGPTGKTTLCDCLKEMGFSAIQPWEKELRIKMKQIKDESNDNTANIVITLNKMLPERDSRFRKSMLSEIQDSR